MRNTLTIQSLETCKCICVDSVDDGTNKIYLSLVVNNVTNPTLVIYKDGTEASTIALTPNQTNLVLIPETLYGAGVSITFRYLDANYTGDTFTINFPSKLAGDMLIKKINEYIYAAAYNYVSAYLTEDDVDDALSATSVNPVQNKVVTAALVNKASKDWKLVGAGTSVDISQIYDKAYEYWVEFKDSNDLVSSWLIPYQEIGKIFTNGYFYSSSYYATVAINTSKTSISVSNSWSRINNNGTISTTGTIAVYYR